VAAAGVPTDWVELINVADQDISLLGLALSDDDAVDAATLAARALPDVVMGPGELVVVDVDSAGFAFRFGGDEAAFVMTLGGTVVDSLDWNEGDSPAGGSFARVPDGVGDG